MQGFEETKSVGNTQESQPIVEVQETNIVDTKNIAGLSQEEMNDVNKIKVTIADKDAPVVVLFGPASCGKTMTLVRMARFLKVQGYTLEPVRTFRPSFDNNYRTLCDEFDNIVNSDDAAKRTDHISFMLVRVIRNGRTICQILEGPGELYFNPNSAQVNFPTYFHSILNENRLRKIFVFFVEPDYLDDNNRRNYVSVVNKVKELTEKQSYIFLYNKVDKSSFVIRPGVVRNEQAMHQVSSDYPGIFEGFRNNNPITSLWRTYNFRFVPFQTGTYTKPNTGDLVYIQGSDAYPKLLWQNITKFIRG